ncbi:phosphate uptake regulator PhoU [Fructilactobacillus fructivorans]|nr:phosphate uptake regulator PhoU [Fructilactobacillus fructivorans]
MLEQVLEAFFEGNAAEAKKIADQDESIDKYYHSTRKLVTESLKKNSQTAQAALSYLMVIRLLERIGDHVVNLAEWLVYNQTGKMVELSHSTNHEEEYFENGQ